MVAGGERGGAVGDAAQQVVEPVGVALGEIAEDVVGDQALVAGMTDAEADAGVLRADTGSIERKPLWPAWPPPVLT